MMSVADSAEQSVLRAGSCQHVWVGWWPDTLCELDRHGDDRVSVLYDDSGS